MPHLNPRFSPRRLDTERNRLLLERAAWFGVGLSAAGTRPGRLPVPAGDRAGVDADPATTAHAAGARPFGLAQVACSHAHAFGPRRHWLQRPGNAAMQTGTFGPTTARPPPPRHTCRGQRTPPRPTRHRGHRARRRGPTRPGRPPDASADAYALANPHAVADTHAVADANALAHAYATARAASARRRDHRRSC